VKLLRQTASGSLVGDGFSGAFWRWHFVISFGNALQNAHLQLLQVRVTS
jgi:hypothetical protein